MRLKLSIVHNLYFIKMKRFLFGLTCALISLTTVAETLIHPEKIALCASCHGTLGVSLNPDWPSLAGQHAGYLAKQMHDYKNASTRSAAMMTPMVSQLSDDDMTEIATYYASLPLAKGKTSKKYQVRGDELYRRGDYNLHITACIACHGPQGTGNAQAGFPVLSGQQPGYTILQLLAFKDKSRRNDLNSIMRDIGGRMDRDDIEAVAYYLAGLH